MCDMCDERELTAWVLQVMQRELAERQRNPAVKAFDMKGEPRPGESASFARAA